MPKKTSLDPATQALIKACDKYAAHYANDHREDIVTDVRNAFFAGAKYAAKASANPPAAKRQAKKDWREGLALFISGAGIEWDGKGKMPAWLRHQISDEEDLRDFVNELHPDAEKALADLSKYLK